MVRPLKDIVAELEEKHKGFELLYDLEERRRMITQFDRDMAYLLERFETYDKDVRFVIDHKLDVNIISRMTLNLSMVMYEMCKSLADYDYLIRNYLLDNYYEKNHDWWASFVDIVKKTQYLLDRLQKINVFEVEKPDDGDVVGRMFSDKDISDVEEITAETGLLEFHREEVEKFNGAELIVCLKHFLMVFLSNLMELKLCTLERDDALLQSKYESNYLLYAKKYWPNQVNNFRAHNERYKLKGKVNISELEQLRREIVMDFEYHTRIGKIWRDYSEDIPQMVIHLEEEKIDETQWGYFFQRIFEIDEYDRWIEEIRIDDSDEVRKAKEMAAVLVDNKEFMRILQKAVKKDFCHQDGWQYKWKVKVEAAYFASLANEKFKLSKRKIQGKKTAVSWAPFEALFGLRGLRTAFNDYKLCKTKLAREEEIDKLFD